MEPGREKKHDETSSFTMDTAFLTDDEMWGAVQDREPSAEGKFLYAVVSTGIYCRPTCASRRPLRKNVQFYKNVDAAEKAGFRACQRCVPKGETTAHKEASWIALVCEEIQAAREIPSLAKLAQSVGLSESHLHRRFKEQMGVTPKQYALALRSGRLKQQLQVASSITEAAYAAGFHSSARFYASSSEILGMTPTEYRRGGRGVAIQFAVGECSLGSVLVAASERGVCAILLGEDPDALARDLEDRFSQADLAQGDEKFHVWVSEVVGFIDAPRAGLSLPLDVRGTVFQRRVWQALTEIPVGETVSYAELAARLGDSNAARAVASACAANPLAVAIPCHRVVRADGSLSGYRWGIERKRKLLEREAAGRRAFKRSGDF